MSGPKVTRVVTKREVMSICQGRMEALRNAIDEWRRCAARYDALTEQKEQEIEARFKNITRMYEREQFLNVQKQCSVEMISIQNEMNQIQEQAIAEAEKDRSLRRRLQYSAETLVRAFASSGRAVPEELQKIAGSALSVDEVELSNMSSKLNSFLTEYTLSSADAPSMTPLQKELSKKLAEGEKLQTLAEWQTRQAGSSHIIEADRRLDKLLAEIQALENNIVISPFLTRAAMIAKEPSSNRRSLLTDSLILDLASHCRVRKEKESSLTLMREVYAELRRFSSKAAKDLAIALSKTIDSEDTINGALLKEKCLALVREETKAMTGASRREAILKGLAELGYEVRENMATAWAEDGRIVIQKPNEKGYGIELASVADAEKFQVQLVSLEQSAEAAKLSRDRDRETIWCSEFGRLQSLLEKSGSELIIEKAIPAGAKPLKQVAESSLNSRRERKSKGSSLRSRQHE
jgi:hypothetical protein